jgi:hypothetical protein
MYVRYVRTAACATLLMVLMAPAFAAQPQGRLQGLVSQANTDAPLTATFNSGTVLLHFGPELSCDATAVFLKEADGEVVYRVNRAKSTGGFCDRIQAAGKDTTDIRFKAKDARKWSIHFDSMKASLINHWSGQLEPVAAP